MTPSLEGWPTKAKEPPSPHEVRLAPLDTIPVFQNLGEESDGLLEPFESKIKWFVRTITLNLTNQSNQWFPLCTLI